MKVILSIKPEYVEKILNGTKKYEFRKSQFTATGVKSVLIYATKPIGKIVGEFEIDAVHVDKPCAIWLKTKEHAGIRKKFFDEYYKGKTFAVAIKIGRVNKFPLPLDLKSFGKNLTAPQSFRYLGAVTSDAQMALKI